MTAINQIDLLLEAPEDSDEPWVGVDLDGVLAHYDSFEGDDVIGEPVKKMVDLVKDWIKDGKKVKIFTARAASKKAVKAIKAWLKGNGLPELDVTNIKDHAMVELYDDRAFQVKKNTGEIVGNDED